jgi:hypothetical protein
MDVGMAVRATTGRDWLELGGPKALLAFVITFGIAIYPVFSHDFISINDIYDHVARAAVLAHFDEVESYSQYWAPNWHFVPYFGFDLVAGGLLSWFGIGFVAKLMVAASLLSLFGGGVVLSRIVHGRWSAVALTCALLLLSRMLLSGLVNYLFGLGLALLGASAWIALRDRPTYVRVLVLGSFATAVCAVHLLACGVLGIVVAGIELAVLAERRSSLPQSLFTFVLIAVAFVPALVLVVFVAPHPEYYNSVIYSSLTSRLGAFAVPLTYAPIEEAVGFVAVGVAILACWITGRMRVDRRLMAAAALLALVQLGAPDSIGAATAVDHRIPIALWIVVFCAVEIRMNRALLAAGFMVLIATVLVARTVLTDEFWTRQDGFYDEALKDLKVLPRNARIGTAFPLSAQNSATGPAMALFYLPVMEFVPNGGFTQTVFTHPDQHPLVMQPSFERLSNAAYPSMIWDLFVKSPEAVPHPAGRSETLAAVMSYDYLVFLDPHPFEVNVTDLLEPLKNGPGIQIFKVRHPDQATAAGDVR